MLLFRGGEGLKRLGAYSGPWSLSWEVRAPGSNLGYAFPPLTVHMLFEMSLLGIYKSTWRCLRVKVFPSNYLVVTSVPLLGST